MVDLVMSDLRNNLDRLKHQYQSLRYPGDLARDVPVESRGPLRRLGPILALAAALAIVLTVWVMTRSTDEIAAPMVQVSDLPEPAIETTESIVVQMPVFDTSAIEVPTWAGIEPAGFSESASALPAQSLTLPSITEIAETLDTEM